MYPSQMCYACYYDQLSEKFNNGWKNQSGQFIAIFRILRQQFDLVGAIT